ncbi:peptide deformylase [Candidatus Parcubacteria bacterium]|nr:peptide deformylase [Candidatus Parcubacteria bacterium]
MQIVQTGDPVLRKVAEPVSDNEFGTKTLAGILEKMAKALLPEEDRVSVGVALAAPQIGIGKRIFIVRHDRVDPSYRTDAKEKLPAEIGVFINPEIIRTSRKKVDSYEGCLSVRHKFGFTKRYERVTVRATDEHGKTFTRGSGGLLAQIFQHEIDHLNGVLFIDHAVEVREVHDEKSDDA